MAITVNPEVFRISPDETNVTGNIPLGIGLMKGDMLVYRGEGDIVRLPVGTDGQVLTADSTSELGVKWVTPS